jgi:hypothetical protein
MVPGFEGEMLDKATVQECRSIVFGSKPMPFMALGRRRRAKVVEGSRVWLGLRDRVQEVLVWCGMGWKGG